MTLQRGEIYIKKPIKDKNSQYYWSKKLINAIEVFTAVKRNDRTFYYNDQDFSWALERDLYFSILPIIYKLDSMKKGETVYVDNAECREVLLLMTPKFGLNFKISLKARVYTMIHGISLFREIFLRLKERRKNKYKSVSYIKTSHLIIINHHKFIRYLELIYKGLNDVSFVICADISKSSKLCEDKGYRYFILKLHPNSFKNFNPCIGDLIIEYHKLRYLFHETHPKSIIFAEGNAPVHELANLAAKKEPGLSVICIQQGWSPIVHNGFRNMHYDLFLSWGGVFTDILQPYNPRQKIINVGTHVLQVEKSSIKKDSILFLSQGFDFYDKSKSLLDFAIYVAKKNPKQKVIIREHPSSPIQENVKLKLNKLRNVRLMCPDLFSLSEVLNMSKIAVSTSSTVLYECILYNIVPFCFSTPCAVKMKPNLFDMNLGVEADNFDKAVTMMDELLNNEREVPRPFFRKNSPNKESFFLNSGDRAVEHIIRIINTHKR
jgi:hypothetical protein